MALSLTVIEPTGEIATHVFEGDEVSVGRSASNDLPFDPLRYEQISRKHGRIITNGKEEFFFEDLESRHGSFINGEKVRGTRKLKLGDAVMISPDGPVVQISWRLPRITGEAGTHLRMRQKLSPAFPLAFSDGFFQRFLRYEKIAAGGFGEIWKAIPTGNEPPLAIKLLHPLLLEPDHLQQIDRESLVRRFAREARIQHLLHEAGVPSTVKVHSWGDDPFRDYLYIIMDLIEGHTFDRLIIREGMMSEARVARLLLPVASALAASHVFEFTDDKGSLCKGVIHRDLKPNNILVEAGSGTVRLLDFGVAGIIQGGDRITAANITVGTLHFLPPESLRDGIVSVMTDLWGLAVTVYLALSGGRFPYEGRGKRELLASIEAGRLTPITNYRSDLSPNIADALTRSLGADPSLRIQSAAEWAALLEKSL